MKPKLKTRDLAYIGLMAAVIAVCSWISVPMAVPFTLQTFAVCMAAGLLGTRRSLLCLAVYSLLGAVGLPVFSGFRGGIGHLLGTTGGYIIGFFFTALVVGLLCGRFGHSFRVLFASMVLGVAMCYLFGTAWFMLVYLRSTGPVTLATVLGWCVVPFILPDLCKIGLAALMVRRLERVLAL